MPEVKVYSTPTCPWCKMAKKLLEDHSILYKDVNVAADKAVRDEMVAKSGQLGVPVIEVDGQIMVGFDETKLRQLVHLPPAK